MINAALKIFATAGYAHASTDDIVREAGISKGLLFHYFISKLGLYTFLYDYAVKFEQLEISTCVGKDETDFFVLRSRVLKAQADCMRNYPYLTLFIERAEKEEDEEAARAIGAQVIAHATALRTLQERVDVTRFKPEADIAMVGRMLSGAFRSILSDILRLETDVPGEYIRACEAYLSMMRQLCYRETETEGDAEQNKEGAV